MSTVTLMQGDCCEKLNGIPANSVNLVLADPPYGITHQAWDTVLPFEDFITINERVCFLCIPRIYRSFFIGPK